MKKIYFLLTVLYAFIIGCGGISVRESSKSYNNNVLAQHLGESDMFFRVLEKEDFEGLKYALKFVIFGNKGISTEEKNNRIAVLNAAKFAEDQYFMFFIKYSKATNKKGINSEVILVDSKKNNLLEWGEHYCVPISMTDVRKEGKDVITKYETLIWLIKSKKPLSKENIGAANFPVSCSIDVFNGLVKEYLIEAY